MNLYYLLYISYFPYIIKLLSDDGLSVKKHCLELVTELVYRYPDCDFQYEIFNELVYK